MEKPAWAITKERKKKAQKRETYWIFGIHAVRDALCNPARKKKRLVVTQNALMRLEDSVQRAGVPKPEIVDARRFWVPLDPSSVHQGAGVEVFPLEWKNLDAIADEGRFLVLLDRVSDPHNVGAILRSAEIFGAGAVIAPRRHSALESGALAKTASGALERLAYLRVGNLAQTIRMLKEKNYFFVGLDEKGKLRLEMVKSRYQGCPFAIVLGAEGAGLRAQTKALCDVCVNIPSRGEFGSLNVSNAAAIACYVLAGMNNH